MGAFRLFRAARRRVRSRSGQAVVEFAFVVPLLVLLIVAIVDFGRALLQYQVVTDSAREGARQAVISGGPAADSIFTVVTTALAVGGVDVSGATLAEDESCTPPTDSPAGVVIYPCLWDSTVSGDQVRVGIVVPYEFSLLGPFIGWATGDNTIYLRSSIAMRNE